MAPKKESGKKSVRKNSSDRINDMLINNFVNLQKSLTDLTMKFDNLTEQMSKLLALFEVSAKSFAEKLSSGIPDIEKDKEFLDKLNTLVEQNKLIAKGLIVMEEKMRERLYGYPPGRQPTRPSLPSRTLPAGFEKSRL